MTIRSDEIYRKVLEDKQNGTFRVFTPKEFAESRRAAQERYEQALALRVARLGPIETHRCVSCGINVTRLHHQEYIHLGWTLNVEGKDYCSALNCRAKGRTARALEKKAKAAGRDSDCPLVAGAVA